MARCPNRLTCGDTHFEVVTGKGVHSDTVFLQINQLGSPKPVPVMYAYRRLDNGNVWISMHYEGLPFPLFTEFAGIVRNQLVDQFDLNHFT